VNVGVVIQDAMRSMEKDNPEAFIWDILVMLALASIRLRTFNQPK
jgi:hypothetical protein